VSQRDKGNLTSLSLLDRVKADDQQAWQHLVGLYTPLVWHWCARWQVTTSRFSTRSGKHHSADPMAPERVLWLKSR